METGAEFSKCRSWRYILWRRWEYSLPMMNVIGLNPSTADETSNDPTIRRCIGFARDWDFGGFYMTNLFAFRATLPKDLRKAPEPVGPENDRWILEAANRSKLILAAWGRNGDFHGRDMAVCRLIPQHLHPDLYCFRISPRTGMPEHPLYLPKTLRPISYRCRPSSRHYFASTPASS
jgi:hypothetical protein